MTGLHRASIQPGNRKLIIDEGLRVDILVDDLIIVELKAQEASHPVWQAPLLRYLKRTKKDPVIP